MYLNSRRACKKDKKLLQHVPFNKTNEEALILIVPKINGTFQIIRRFVCETVTFIYNKTFKINNLYIVI